MNTQLGTAALFCKSDIDPTGERDLSLKIMV